MLIIATKHMAGDCTMSSLSCRAHLAKPRVCLNFGKGEALHGVFDKNAPQQVLALSRQVIRNLIVPLLVITNELGDSMAPCRHSVHAIKYTSDKLKVTASLTP